MTDPAASHPWTGSPAGSVSPAAFACRSVLSSPRCISSNCGATLPDRLPSLGACCWSLPGLWLRGYAAGYVKKNRELTTNGPLRPHPQSSLLGSMLIAAGFAVALLSWPVALALTMDVLVIYVPVIASEERFLRATFPRFEVLPSRAAAHPEADAVHAESATNTQGGFSWALYLKHREYNALYRSSPAVSQPAASSAGSEIVSPLPR